MLLPSFRASGRAPPKSIGIWDRLNLHRSSGSKLLVPLRAAPIGSMHFQGRPVHEADPASTQWISRTRQLPLGAFRTLAMPYPVEDTRPDHWGPTAGRRGRQASLLPFVRVPHKLGPV